MNKKKLAFIITAACALYGCGDDPRQQRTTKIFSPTNMPFGMDSKVVKPIEGADCHIDSINDLPGEGREIYKATNEQEIMYFSGWAAISAGNGVAPNKVVLQLKSIKPEGPDYFYDVNKTIRDDVASYFNKKSLVNTGFEAEVNISNVKKGSYQLRVLELEGEKVHACKYTANIEIE